MTPSVFPLKLVPPFRFINDVVVGSTTELFIDVEYGVW